jgi:hypothetical protein
MNGNIIAFNDDAGNCGSQSALSFPTAGLGSVFIIVEGWGMEMGEYTLSIEADYVGLQDENTMKLNVYPNPTNGIVHLNSPSGVLTLFHINGTELATFNTDEMLDIDLSTLTPGTYFLKSIEGIVSAKIILVK